MEDIDKRIKANKERMDSYQNPEVKAKVYRCINAHACVYYMLTVCVHKIVYVYNTRCYISHKMWIGFMPVKLFAFTYTLTTAAFLIR